MEMVHIIVLFVFAPEATASCEVEAHRKMVVHGISAVVADVKRHTGTGQITALERQTDTETEALECIIITLCKCHRADYQRHS